MSRTPACCSNVDNIGAIVVVCPGPGHHGRQHRVPRSQHRHSPLQSGIVTVEPHHDEPDPHVHEDEDDASIILGGQRTVRTPEEGRPNVIAGPGTFVRVPPSVVHTFANNGDAQVRVLNIHAPSGLTVGSVSPNLRRPSSHTECPQSERPRRRSTPTQALGEPAGTQTTISPQTPTWATQTARSTESQYCPHPAPTPRNPGAGTL
jgi:mannose-6-phosphate isomerase-like protein (cupin superfamily)